MNDETTIERIVMHRIYIIRVLRPIVSSGALALFVFALALWGIGREVWVAMVFKNGPQGFLGHSLYLVYAFEHTRFLVQALTVISLMSLVYLARETARLISTLLTPQRA